MIFRVHFSFFKSKSSQLYDLTTTVLLPKRFHIVLDKTHNKKWTVTLPHIASMHVEGGNAEERQPLHWGIKPTKPTGAGAVRPTSWFEWEDADPLPSLSMFYGYALIVLGFFLASGYPPGLSIPSQTSDGAAVSNVRCYRASRLEHHVIVHIPLGEAIVDALLVFETTHERSVRLFAHHIGTSATIQCDYGDAESLCQDKTIVDTRSGSKYASLEFRLHSNWLEMTSHSLALQLGLEGDVRLRHDHTYWVGKSLFCWEAATLSTPTVEDPHVPLVLADNRLFANVDDFAGIAALEQTPNYHYKTECNRPNHLAQLFPSSASREATWLGFVSEADKLELSNSALERRRVVVEVGTRCATELGLSKVGAVLTSMDCSRGTCPTDASLPLRRLANHEIMLSFANATPHMLVEALSLDLPALQSEQEQIGWGVARLCLILITAAILYVRAGSQSTDTLEILLVHLRDYRASRGDKSKPHKAQSAGEAAEHNVSSALVGLCAITLRSAVLAWRLPFLWRDDFQRLALVQIVSTLVSFGLWVARLVRSTHVTDKSFTMLYGGSTAILDLLLAVIVAYAAPPLLNSYSTFESTARLLVTLIIASVSVPRAVVGMVATTIEALHTLSPFAGGGLHGSAVLGAVAGWVAQTLCLSITITDVFAHPFARRMTRGTVESTGGYALLLSLTVVCTGLPALSTLSCSLVEC